MIVCVYNAVMLFRHRSRAGVARCNCTCMQVAERNSHDSHCKRIKLVRNQEETPLEGFGTDSLRCIASDAIELCVSHRCVRIVRDDKLYLQLIISC